MTTPRHWHKVAEPDELPEGRVKTVTVDTTSLALVHFNGQYSAMDNRCPHQGGPLGEGSIETGIDGKCWLRCPWHGWDFDPLTGKPPGGHEDAGQALYPVESREDGVYIAVSSAPEHEATVTDVMAETMVNWGVRRVFGMVGHSNLGLADALRRQTIKGKLHYVGIRHEGAAAFACSGYAKLTGSPAACLTIAGPGATNLMTGLWDAKVDRAPVLALTGQVQTQVFGPGAFQDIDLSSAFEAVTRFSQSVLPSSRHAELMTLACKHAIVERDVAHLIFPDDTQTLPAGETKAQAPAGRLAAPTVAPDEAESQRALEAISTAQRPLIVVGYGARNAMPQITALAERLQAPVVTTFKAKGQIADSHPNAAGVLGRSGTPIASWFMAESDLIIALGSSFSNHTGIEPKLPIVQVDFEAMQIGKFHPVDYPVLGEIGRTVDGWLAALPETVAAIDQRDELAARWAAWREEKASRREDNLGNGINAAFVFDTLSTVAPADAVIPVDVGNNTYSFGRYFECRQQRVLMSGYLGSIGFSLPAAIGAWCATQDFEEYAGRKVVSVSGDGGLGQYLAEVTTLVKYNMDVTHVLLNNGELGKISKEQRAGEWDVWETDLLNPNFAEYAELCGAMGIRVSEADELENALRRAIEHDGPALVEIMTDAELV
ncbi:MAG: thiamine pyrophosphate-dependent enzyme [Pseudomonadota bacterium]